MHCSLAQPVTIGSHQPSPSWTDSIERLNTKLSSCHAIYATVSSVLLP